MGRDVLSVEFGPCCVLLLLATLIESVGDFPSLRLLVCCHATGHHRRAHRAVAGAATAEVVAGEFCQGEPGGHVPTWSGGWSEVSEAHSDLLSGWDLSNVARAH